jgi:hypothetical protein
VSAQLALFLETTPSLEGLRYQPNFISPAEEQDLIGHIRALPLAPLQFGAFEGKRRVASFGWRYDYGQQKLGQAEDVPAWITPVIADVEVFAGLPAGAVQRCCARNMTSVSGSAGIATSPTSTKSLACLSPLPATSGFAAS